MQKMCGKERYNKLVFKKKFIAFIFLCLAMPYTCVASESFTIWSDPLLPQIKINFLKTERSFGAVIDTGTHVSFIDQGVMQNLKLRTDESKSQEVYFPAIGKTIKLFRADPIDIQFSRSLAVTTINPLVYPKSASNNKEFDAVSEIITGHGLVLGMEDLRTLDFNINYRKQQAIVTASMERQPNIDGRFVSYDIPTEIAGETIDCTIDTGAPDIPGIFIQAGHPKFATVMGKFQNFLPMAQIFSSSGKSLATHDPEGKVAGLSGEGLLVEFETYNEGEKTSDRCYIGGGILKGLQLGKKGSELLYYDGKLPPINYNRIGFKEIKYDPKQKALILTRLFEHGALTQAGISEGDILLSINGIEAHIENIPVLRNLVRSPSGTKLRVTVSSKGEADLNVRKTVFVVLSDVLINQ